MGCDTLLAGVVPDRPRILGDAVLAEGTAPVGLFAGGDVDRQPPEGVPPVELIGMAFGMFSTESRLFAGGADGLPPEGVPPVELIGMGVGVFPRLFAGGGVDGLLPEGVPLVEFIGTDVVETDDRVSRV